MSNPMLGTRELRFTDFTGGTDNCLDYATHTNPSSPYYAPVGSRAEVWKDGRTYKYLAEDTGATPDGFNVIQSVAGGYSGSIRWSLYGSSGSNSISVVLPVSAFPDGMANAEMWSYLLPSSKFARLKRISIRAAGNIGPISGLSVELAETDDFVSFTSLYSTNDAAAGNSLVDSSPAKIIVVRVSNSSGTVQNASVLVILELL